jgi:hypothetical protein
MAKNRFITILSIWAMQDAQRECGIDQWAISVGVRTLNTSETVAEWVLNLICDVSKSVC